MYALGTEIRIKLNDCQQQEGKLKTSKLDIKFRVQYAILDSKCKKLQLQMSSPLLPL